MATDEKVLYPKLRGSVNYQSWRINLEAAFAAEDAIDIVNGEEPCPPKPATVPNLSWNRFREQLPPPEGRRPALTDEQVDRRFDHYKEDWKLYRDWQTKNGKAINLIRRHLDKSCLPVIDKSTDSSEAWTRLEQQYSTTNVAVVIEHFERLDKLGEKTFNSNADLTGRVTQNMTELRNLQKLNTADEVWDLFETWFVYRTCGPEFYHLKEKIKGMTFAEFKADAIKQLVNAHASMDARPSAQFTRKRKRTEGGQQQQPVGRAESPSKRQKLKCSHCQKPNHDESTCWIKDPSKRPSRSQGTQAPRSQTRSQSRTQGQPAQVLPSRPAANTA